MALSRHILRRARATPFNIRFPTCVVYESLFVCSPLDSHVRSGGFGGTEPPTCVTLLAERPIRRFPSASPRLSILSGDFGELESGGTFSPIVDALPAFVRWFRWSSTSAFRSAVIAACTRRRSCPTSFSNARLASAMSVGVSQLTSGVSADVGAVSWPPPWLVFSSFGTEDDSALEASVLRTARAEAATFSTSTCTFCSIIVCSNEVTVQSTGALY